MIIISYDVLQAYISNWISCCNSKEFVILRLNSRGSAPRCSSLWRWCRRGTFQGWKRCKMVWRSTADCSSHPVGLYWRWRRLITTMADLECSRLSLSSPEGKNDFKFSTLGFIQSMFQKYLAHSLWPKLIYLDLDINTSGSPVRICEGQWQSIVQLPSARTDWKIISWICVIHKTITSCYL